MRKIKERKRLRKREREREKEKERKRERGTSNVFSSSCFVMLGAEGGRTRTDFFMHAITSHASYRRVPKDEDDDDACL